MNLTQLQPIGEILRLRCEGTITSEDVLGRDPLPEFLGQTGYSGRVLFDMEAVAFIDSAAIGWLVRCNHRFREAGGRFIIHSIPPMVDNVFQLLRMPTILSLAKDERAAQAAAMEGK